MECEQDEPSGPKLFIAPTEWAVMLREAGAPEPWCDPDAPQRFAAIVTDRYQPTPPRQRNALDCARDAIAELRRVVPEIIAEKERWEAENDFRVCTGSPNVPTWPSLRDEIQKWRCLLAALPELPEKPAVLRVTPWHLDAAQLYALYVLYVDRGAGISAGGPVCRFVLMALRRMGVREAIEQEAIAKALRRMRQKVSLMIRPRNSRTRTDRL